MSAYLNANPRFYFLMAWEIIGAIIIFRIQVQDKLKEQQEVCLGDSIVFVLISILFGAPLSTLFVIFYATCKIEDSKFWKKPIFMTKERKTERILFSPKELKKRDSKKKQSHDDYWPGY